MAGSKKLVGMVVGLLGVCLVIVLADSSSHHPNANFKGSPYGIKKVEHQALESSPVSEVDYVDGPLAPLYDFLIQHRLQRFCKLIRDAGLEQVIQDLGGSWTLFAPTDASFIFLPGGTLEELQRNPQLLRDFILYHFVVGDFPSSQIQNELLVDSVQGSPLRFNIYGQTLMVSGAEIIEPDLLFDLGRVYIIDRPLYPIPSEDTLAYLQGNYRQMYNMLVDVGLIDYISSGTFTLLVPDDQAFDYLSVELKDALATNISLAERILLNHILPGSIYVGGITDGMQWETAGGSPITFTVKRGLTFVEGIPIILPDVSLTNGVIHVINRVLLPEGVEADCQCKPSSETAQKPGQVSGRPSRPSQRPPYGQGATTSRPGQPAQTPRPGGSPVRGTTGQRGTPGTPSRPQGPVTSPGQPGSRPWSPSRTGQPNRPVPSPSQITRSPYQPDSSSDEDINSVVGTGAQPDSGQRRPGQTTRYPPPPPPPRQRVTPRPPPVASKTTRRPAGGAYPDSEKENYPEQEVTPGVPQTTRPGDRWSNRQRTPAPRYPTPQRGAYNTPTTRRPLTTRTYDWNQPRITQPPFERPDQGAGTDFPAENEDQGLQTQKPSVSTSSWQQRKQITQTTRQPIQRTTFKPPRQPVSPQRRTTIAPSRTTTSPRIPSNQQPQPNCRRQGERITTINRNLPVCSVTPSEGCQNSPYNPADPRPLCPQSEDCRNPNEPSDPSDNRPLCASPVREDCREVGQPTYTGDRRPLCPTSSVQQTGCKDPSAPYNPSDRRPICRTTRAPVTLPPSREPDGSLEGCRRANEVANPQDRRPLCPEEIVREDCREVGQPTYTGDRRPLCPTSSIQQTGCKDPSAPYNPSDRRPVCRTTRAPVTLPPSREPDGSLEGCRRANEVANPQDRRPLCPEEIVREDCREVGQPTYTGDRRPLCPTSSIQQTGCKDPSAPYNPSDRRPVCRTTRAPVTLPPSREPDGSLEGCRQANEVANPQDRRPLCPEETEQDCRPLLERPKPGDRRPICKVSQPHAPNKDTNEVQKKPQQQTTYSPRGQYPTQTTRRQSWQSTTRAPQSWQSTTRAPQRWQSTTRAPQSWQTTQQPVGKQPQTGIKQVSPQTGSGSFQTQPQTDSRQPQTGSYPSQPQSDINPLQPQSGSYPSQPGYRPSQPQTGADVQPDTGTDLEPHTGVHPSQPQSGTHTSQPQSGRYPSQPQSGRYPSQQQPGSNPSQQQSGRYPSQPQTGTRTTQAPRGSYPSQPQTGTYPRQRPGYPSSPNTPQTGAYPDQQPPSQPQSGSYPSHQPGSPISGSDPSQPHSGLAPSEPETPQSGSYPSQPHTGSHPSHQPGSPSSGSYPSQPQSGSYPSQRPGSPQSGSYPSQPQVGSFPSQRPGSPQTGSYPSQPQSGSYPSQQPGRPVSGSYPSQPQSGIHATQPGSHPSGPHTDDHSLQPGPGSPGSSQPSSGFDQPQTGRPSPGYPQRQPGSQQTPQGVSRPGSVGSRPSQPFNPQRRPVGGQGRPGGSLAPAPLPQRGPSTSTTRVPISVTGTSTTPGEDSRRTLYEIVEDPSLLIRGRPVQLTRIFELFHKAGIEDILTGPGPTTVFLPSDDAFALLPKGVVEQLEENPELLRQVLLYHVTQSEVLPSAQPESYTIPSLEGNQLVITMLNGGRLIFISGAKAVAVTRANNGIFYVINQLLYPLPQHDIVTAIQTRPDLSTLAYLLTLTGLEDMLRGQTPYTLLAPTDNAFAQLSQPVYDELTRNTTALQEILLNHIIEGAHYGREFFTGGTFPSARGGKLKFQVVSYGYQVNEINIKTPEIVTGTGVIHLIDQIVLEDPDLRFITNIENSVTGGDGSITDAQQPGSQQPGQGQFSPRRPVSGESFSGAERPGVNQPHIGGLQPSIGQPGPVGRLPTHGQGVSGNQPITPGQPQGNQVGGQRQPGTGTFGQPGHGHQTPGHTTGSTTFGGRQPSVQGARQPVQPQNQPGRHVPGQSGHSSIGGQRTPTHGQRTQTGTFTNPRQPGTQVGGHQTSSGGYQNFGTSNTGGQPNNVADLARSMGLNQFANWITNTGLLEKVHDGGVYTVFAPTDDAVSSLPQDMVYSIESNPNQVKPILEYHIVPQKLNLNSITNDETASTLLQGKNIRFNVYKNSSPGCGQLVTASGTPVGEALATMGSIQVIPITQVLYQPNGNLQNIVEASPILQKLNEAIKTARLTWILSGTGPMTIFAPSDSAFESLTEEERKTLVNDKQAFNDLLKRHILRGTYFASGVHEDLDKKSENNKPIRLSLQEGILTVNSFPVTYSDITATNGVLHVIDQFLN